MAVQTGISSDQARKLLELAGQSNQKPKVRTVQKDSSKQHSGRAFLLEVINDRQAKIQPFNHGGKVETVELDSLRLWKSGNSFDLEEVRKVTPTAVRVKPSIIVQTRVTIFSKKMKAVWGGERVKWTEDFDKVVLWTTNEQRAASATLLRLKSMSLSDDAVLLNEAIAHDALLEVLTQPSAPSVAPLEATPKTATIVAPYVAPPVEKEDLPSAKEDDDFLDLDSIFNPQETALRLAEENRREAVADYKKAKDFFEKSKAKLMLLDASVVKLGGRSGLKGATSGEGKPNGKKKRVYIRNKIQKILQSSSRLDTSAIHSRLLAYEPTLEALRVTHALSAMKTELLAERDENGGWALTHKGRTAELRGDL